MSKECKKNDSCFEGVATIKASIIYLHGAIDDDMEVELCDYVDWFDNITFMFFWVIGKCSLQNYLPFLLIFFAINLIIFFISFSLKKFRGK